MFSRRLEKTAHEISHDPARTYGTVFALHELRKDLGFERALNRALRSGIQRIILVADRGLLSLDNIHHLTDIADKNGRKLEFILAVPARRYGDLVETFRGFDFRTGDGLREASFEGHRLIVAHDAARAIEQSEARRARINELEALGERHGDQAGSAR